MLFRAMTCGHRTTIDVTYTLPCFPLKKMDFPDLYLRVMDGYIPLEVFVIDGCMEIHQYRFEPSRIRRNHGDVFSRMFRRLIEGVSYASQREALMDFVDTFEYALLEGGKDFSDTYMFHINEWGDPPRMVVMDDGTSFGMQSLSFVPKPVTIKIH